MDGDKIKNFFINHIEKMILVVVVGVSGFLVYQGLNTPDVREKYDAKRLENNAKNVRSEVDVNHNSAILPDRIPKFDIVAESERVKQAVDGKRYPFIPLEPPYSGNKSGAKRTDPILIAPRHLEVHGVMMSLAWRSQKGEYALRDLDPADKLEMEMMKAKPRPKAKRSRGGGRGGRGGGGEEDGRGGGGDDDDDTGEMSDFFSGMTDEGLDGGGRGGPGEDMMSGSAVRRVSPSNSWGLRPTDVPYAKDETIMLKPVPRPGLFIAGTAAVPYKELHEAYEAALSQTESVYEPGKRDRPIFLTYQVQRADVTEKAVGELVDADWVKRDGKEETIFDAAGLWAGVAPELVPTDYRDEEITLWFPPVMMDDYSKFALNSKIPMQPWKMIQEATDEKPETEIVIGASGFEIGENTGFSREDDGQSEDREGMGSMGGGFERGGMMMGVEENPPEFKLVRFFDFANDGRDDNSPKPGRKYVYRVRVSVEDPNFPINPISQPQGRDLMPAVYKRISELKSKVIQQGTRAPFAERFTPWSDPSEPVSLPGSQNVFAGPVTRPKTRVMRIPGGETRLYSPEQPMAKMTIDQFNVDFGTRVGVMMDVFPGTVLSKKYETADVVDPITLEVKKVEGYNLRSSATVIDVLGGDLIELHQDEGEFPMQSPGAILIFDENGKLKVHDEADEIELYRIRSFADERGA